ncbi:hypothetical protein DFO69_3622 [Bacillus subtilis]|nr:hypothetical protein DFO69_3622 [Bacillus subtilis]
MKEKNKSAFIQGLYIQITGGYVDEPYQKSTRWNFRFSGCTF